MPGRRTRSAVREFQRDAGLRVDGKLTPGLVSALRAQAGGGPGRVTATMLTATDATLHALPDSGAGRLGQLPAGSRVMTGEVRGTWVQVRALPPARGSGWVDSYALGPDPGGAAAMGGSGGGTTAPARPGEDAGGGFFSGLARGVSSLFGGGASSGGGTGGGTTATIGIRGFDTSQLAAGRPNAAEFARLEGFAVSPAEARSFAAEAGLRSARVAYLPEPRPAGGGAASGSHQRGFDTR